MKKILLGMISLLILGISGLTVLAINKQSCNMQCQATKKVQEMITQAQIDYLNKKTEYELQYQKMQEALSGKQEAYKKLADLFQENSELINGTGFTKFQQEQKLPGIE